MNNKLANRFNKLRFFTQWPKDRVEEMVKSMPPRIRAIDLGAGDAEWIKRQAVRKASKKYVAVDRNYITDQKLSEGNLLVVPSTIEEFVDLMKKYKRKTKYALIRMPYPNSSSEYISKVISEANNILTSKGMLIITTESHELGDQICIEGRQNGFAIEIRNLKNHQTLYERSIGSEFIPRTNHTKQIIMYILRAKKTDSSKKTTWRNRHW